MNATVSELNRQNLKDELTEVREDLETALDKIMTLETDVSALKIIVSMQTSGNEITKRLLELVAAMEELLKGSMDELIKDRRSKEEGEAGE